MQQRMMKFLAALVVFVITYTCVSADTIDTYIDTNLALTNISRVKEMTDHHGEPLNGQGITISIIDTGIQDSGDDHIIDRHNFSTHTEDISDGTVHGTKVRHIISEIAPAASILAYKVFVREYKTAPLEMVADAIRRSIEHKADIINISGGVYANNVVLSNAIEEAVKQGVIIVSVAGNEGRKCGITSPGNNPHVITVGATTRGGDDVAEYSNLGPDPDTGEIKPDIVAPGDYQYNCRGTSFAAPIVTGAIALMKQKHPTWTAQEIKSALGSTAVSLKRDGEVLLPTHQGSGRIDVFKAINTNTLFSCSHLLFNQQRVNLKVRNVGEETLHYSLQWSWDGPHEGLFEQIPSSITLQPGEETLIPLLLETDPKKIDRCWYYPTLKIVCQENQWNIPIVVDSPSTFGENE